MAQAQQLEFMDRQRSREPRTEVNSARKFTYAQLAQATNDFAQINMLGRGGFGVVYKGKILGMNEEVAIKKCIEDIPSPRQRREFEKEIKIISPLHHRNILHLVGWCEEGNNLLLVYEIMNNGSLEDHLYPKVGALGARVYGARHERISYQLSWPKRRDILIGITSGLNYLHHEANKVTLHRDIKPANVMLDKDFNAKLVDFGLVTQVNHTATSYYTLHVCGSKDYIDPVYSETGKACWESDVYSLGVLLLEMVCGEKPTIVDDVENSLIMKVERFRDANNILEAADMRLRGPFDQEMKTVLELGLMCVHQNRKERPNMGVIKQSLISFQQATTLPPGANENALSTLRANEDAGVAPLTFARRWASMP